MAEDEKIEWVGCQWMMQGYCGRRTAAQRTENETQRAEPTSAVGPAPVQSGAEPPLTALSAEPSPRRLRPSKDAWSAARKAAAANRRRRPAA